MGKKRGKMNAVQNQKRFDSFAKDFKNGNPYPFKVNDIVEIVIGDIVSYGVFVKTWKYDFTGLLHRSEVKTGYLDSLQRHFRKGDIIKARVKAIKKGGTLEFSTKGMPLNDYFGDADLNPWQSKLAEVKDQIVVDPATEVEVFTDQSDKPIGVVTAQEIMDGWNLLSPVQEETATTDSQKYTLVPHGKNEPDSPCDLVPETAVGGLEPKDYYVATTAPLDALREEVSKYGMKRSFLSTALPEKFEVDTVGGLKLPSYRAVPTEQYLQQAEYATLYNSSLQQVQDDLIRSINAQVEEMVQERMKQLDIDPEKVKAVMRENDLLRSQRKRDEAHALAHIEGIVGNLSVNARYVLQETMKDMSMFDFALDVSSVGSTFDAGLVFAEHLKKAAGDRLRRS